MNKKHNWHYWMYQYAKKTGFGSTVPDFPQYQMLTKKQFDLELMGQTVSQIRKSDLAILKKLAK